MPGLSKGEHCEVLRKRQAFDLALGTVKNGFLMNDLFAQHSQIDDFSWIVKGTYGVVWIIPIRCLDVPAVCGLPSAAPHHLHESEGGKEPHIAVYCRFVVGANSSRCRTIVMVP